MQKTMVLPQINIPIFLLLLLNIYACRSTPVKEAPKQQTMKSTEVANAMTPDDKPAVAAAVLYQSTDNGKNWSPFANGIPEEATLSAIVQADNKLFIATDYHGIFSSIDGENNWQTRNNGLPKTIDINCLIVEGKKLVLGTLGQGIYFSEDEGLNWKPASQNINYTPIRALIKTKNKIIAGTDTGFFASVDWGNSWTPLFGDMQILGFTTLNNKIYAAAFNGALMSEDEGLTWKYIYQEDALHDIANDGTYIYAMTIGQELLKTDSDGMIWENAQNGIPKPPNFYTNELRPKGKDIFSAQWIGIYHSSDNAKNWKLLNTLPTKTAFSTLEITDFGIMAGISIR